MEVYTMLNFIRLWVILMACELAEDYFMLSDYDIAFIVYLYFLCSYKDFFLHEVLSNMKDF